MGKHKLPALKTIANRGTLLSLVVLSLIVVLAGAWRVKQQADQQLAEERARREKQNLIPYEQKLFKSISSKAIQIWQNHQTARAIVRFNDSYFVASDGGLIELDRTGKLVGTTRCLTVCRKVTCSASPSSTQSCSSVRARRGWSSLTALSFAGLAGPTEPRSRSARCSRTKGVC
jgi:hypothetical protein